MNATGSNFDFLEHLDLELANLGRLAESYFQDDPSTSLIKLRQFSERLTKRHAALMVIEIQPADPPYVIFGDHTRCVKYFAAPFVQGADGVKVFHAGEGVDIRFAYWAVKGLRLPNKGYSRHSKFLKESFFPRPPLDEQREIVRRIETAFAKIDRLAAEAAKALKLLGRLDQRILAKAFAGELVPQDPTDEPAETLLARIRTVRDAAPKAKRRRKTSA